MKASNKSIKLTPFIPPQLYNRLCDLSKNTYEKRQSDFTLKTQIRIGKEDLILFAKTKGDKDWEHEPNLEEMGPISDPQWYKMWPTKNVPDLTSPPKVGPTEERTFTPYPLILNQTPKKLRNRKQRTLRE